MTTGINTAVQEARDEFLQWWGDDKNLGEGECAQVAEKVKKAVKDLPTKELTLHYHAFRFGFGLYYLEKAAEAKFIPITRKDGMILNWQGSEEDGAIWWPLKDEGTDSYYVPKVTINKIPPPSGSMPTDQYLNHLVTMATFSRESREYRILEALKLHAEVIAKRCGDQGLLYRKIKKIVPDFPAVEGFE